MTDWDDERVARAVLSGVCEAGDPRLAALIGEHSAAAALAALRRVKEESAWVRRARASDERALVDALVSELARGDKLNPLSAAAAVDRVVKAEKRPAPLKRAIEWAQKWLLDLTLCSENQAPRYFLAQAKATLDEFDAWPQGEEA